MNNNLLRAPLIKSAVLLAVFSLLVYLTVTSSDGSVWSSLETIFLAVFRAAQLGVGLILALFLCFIVLIGIFLGCVAMVSRESAAKMYDHLHVMVSGKLQFLKSFIRKEEHAIIIGSHDFFSPQLKKEIRVLVDSSIDPLRSEQAASELKLKGLLERIEEVEQNDKTSILAERAERQEDKINNLGEAVVEIKEHLGAIQEKIDRFMHQQQKLHLESLINDLSIRIEKLEDMHHGKETHGKGDSAEEEGGLRLFSYIDDPQARAKIEQLVNDAVQQEMTYAQITEYLVENTGADIAEVLAAHPSLTKDYIRYRRQRS